MFFRNKNDEDKEIKQSGIKLCSAKRKWNEDGCVLKYVFTNINRGEFYQCKMSALEEYSQCVKSYK